MATKPLTALADEPAPPNVLLICVDDLRPELNCFGKDYITRPTSTPWQAVAELSTGTTYRLRPAGHRDTRC